jgi:HK97 family phage portal protein
MQLFGWTIMRTKALPPLQPLRGSRSGGWYPTWPMVRESFPGAWQQNITLSADSVLAYSAVYSCITLISTDIGKLGLRLVQQDADGIWTETSSSAFSPVLRKPNRYQTRIKFIEQWVTSKLVHGNTYVLKQRDERGVVVALYVLDPMRVMPLVAADGAVYYQLQRDDLSNLREDRIAVPARDMIHDTMVCLFHPLVGVSPLFACALAALQGLKIQENSAQFFSQGSHPGGVLTAPGFISQETADRLKAYWDTNFSGSNVGKVAVLGDGLKYEAMAVTAVDAQLIEQLRWTGDTVCSCFHVPPYKIGIAPAPAYNNIQALNQQYYSECLQSIIENLELCLDEGLGLGPGFANRYGTEFNRDDLLLMDTATTTKAAADGVGSGCISPNEARRRYFGLGPVTGGESPMVQQQYYSLEALAERDADKPFAKPTAATPPIAPEMDDEDDEPEDDDEEKDLAVPLLVAVFERSLRQELAR